MQTSSRKNHLILQPYSVRQTLFAILASLIFSIISIIFFFQALLSFSGVPITSLLASFIQSHFFCW